MPRSGAQVARTSFINLKRYLRFSFPQKGDTVQFSNDAYTGSSMMSFDNVLFDNLEADPVLMQPLDFPIDDKQPLPQVRH